MGVKVPFHLPVPFPALLERGLRRDPPVPGLAKAQVQALEAPTQEMDTIDVSFTRFIETLWEQSQQGGQGGAGAQLAARICRTQGMSSVTRAYTPGVEVEQVPLPQDTMPTRVQAPSFWQTRGPPESPYGRRRSGLGSGSPGGVPRCSPEPSPGRGCQKTQHKHTGKMMKET